MLKRVRAFPMKVLLFLSELFIKNSSLFLRYRDSFLNESFRYDWNRVTYKALCANFIMQKSILSLIGNQPSKITSSDLLQRPFTKEQLLSITFVVVSGNFVMHWNKLYFHNQFSKWLELQQMFSSFLWHKSFYFF